MGRPEYSNLLERNVRNSLLELNLKVVEEACQSLLAVERLNLRAESLLPLLRWSIKAPFESNENLHHLDARLVESRTRHQVLISRAVLLNESLNEADNAFQLRATTVAKAWGFSLLERNKHLDASR